jgi:voltage-gated potassium channel Kch
MAGIGGAASGWFIAVVALVIGGVVTWPYVAITEAGVMVRNLRTVSVAWPELHSVRIGDQLPYIGRFWRLLHEANNAVGAEKGYPGVLIERKDGKVVPVFAAQRPPFRLGSATQWADKVQAAIEEARPRHAGG